MAATNCGVDTATNEATMAVASSFESRRTAASTPMLRPIASSQAMADTISSSVAGRREATISATSVFWA